MNAIEAKKLLEPIPSEDFILNYFTDKKSKCCAIGHLIRLTSNNPENYSVGNCGGGVYSMNPACDFSYNVVRKYTGSYSLSNVNNEKIDVYQQETAKERVMAFLEDIIKNVEN